MAAFPLLTGVITIILLGGVAWVLWSEDQLLWGGLAAGFALLRLGLLIGQMWRLYRRRTADADEDRAI